MFGNGWSTWLVTFKISWPCLSFSFLPFHERNLSGLCFSRWGMSCLGKMSFEKKVGQLITAATLVSCDFAILLFSLSPSCSHTSEILVVCVSADREELSRHNKFWKKLRQLLSATTIFYFHSFPVTGHIVFPWVSSHKFVYNNMQINFFVQDYNYWSAFHASSNMKSLGIIMAYCTVFCSLPLLVSLHYSF